MRAGDKVQQRGAVPESSSPTSTAVPGEDVRDPPGHEADRYRVILDSVVEAIVVFDPVTNAIEEVNRGTCDLLGKSRDELVGQRFESVLKPAESARLPAIIGPLVSGDRESSTVMLDYLPAHGRPATVEVVLQAVDLPGSSRAIVAIARDVRERIEVQVRLQRLAQAEHARAAELNAVIRAMGEAVVVCAADGTITLTNPAGERLVKRHARQQVLAVLDEQQRSGLDAEGGHRIVRPHVPENDRAVVIRGKG